MSSDSAKSAAIRFIYIGGPTVLIEFDGLRFITDPTFDVAGGEYKVGPLITLKKTKGPIMSSEELGAIDVVLLSHDHHADNLDREGRELLKKIPRVFTTESGAERLKGEVRGLKPWQSVLLKTPNGNTIRITATPARHGPPLIEKLAGDVIGFVLTWEEQKTDLVYITGDTVWYRGVEEVSHRFRPKAVLLFAGAAQARGPVSLTMDASDAIETATAFNDAVILPVHCEGWAHFSQGQGDIEQAFSAIGLRERLRLFIPDGHATVDVP